MRAACGVRTYDPRMADNPEEALRLNECSRHESRGPLLQFRRSQIHYDNEEFSVDFMILYESDQRVGGLSNNRHIEGIFLPVVHRRDL